MATLPHDLTTTTCLVELYTADEMQEREPVWTGTLDAWWQDNQELGWTWGDVHAALVELAAGVPVQLGGGAGQGFTLVRAYGDRAEHTAAALIALAALRDCAEIARDGLERGNNPGHTADQVRNIEIWAEDAKKHLTQIDPRPAPAAVEDNPPEDAPEGATWGAPASGLDQ